MKIEQRLLQLASNADLFDELMARLIEEKMRNDAGPLISELDNMLKKFKAWRSKVNDARDLKRRLLNSEDDVQTALKELSAFTKKHAV